ncbi:MAG: hypothetical protein A2X08_08295 [Bacteroidetes bacterium GWA2_32_17]|nr:MAG: hypothetical protein A2X08_08295 [Bacteroidetes bacterium GWA2_32_17]
MLQTKNKLPSIGLMKLATYHKLLGDKVVFYKGELNEFVIERSVDSCIKKMSKIDNSINWKAKYFKIYEYIKKRHASSIEELEINDSKYEILLLNALKYYKDYYWKKEFRNDHHWDRVYITTLFTFHWGITIKTIEFVKQLVKSENDIWVGGVMASVIPKEIKQITGLKNIHVGLLNKSGILDKNNIIVDNLPLDYSILDEIDYKYPENNAYYGYTTRGCVRKCEFCAVPIIEPKFNKYVPLTEKITGVTKKYGEKRNLLLLDNNVLASPRFHDIIAEIKKNGFDKKQKFHESNQLKIAVSNLRKNLNEKAYINKAVTIFNELLEKINSKQEIYNLLSENNLLKPQTAIKKKILDVFPIINPLYEKYRNKIPKQRYVDFNQGVDARLLTEEKARLLSQIPIRPLRIAFDSMKYEEEYLSAIFRAKKYGIKHFSNYLLYNFEDKPVELYQRLRINVELSDEYKINIYSFPMKFHPIFGDYHLNRDFLGEHWNRKFIRAVQVILNATKGKIGTGKSFFYKAFGHNDEEFHKLLYMPETYLLFRFFFEKEGLAQDWWNSFKSLTEKEMKLAKGIIEKNDFKRIDKLTKNIKIINLLKHYTISREQISDSKSKLSKLKIKFDKLEKAEKYGVFESIECF